MHPPSTPDACARRSLLAALPFLPPLPLAGAGAGQAGGGARLLVPGPEENGTALWGRRLAAQAARPPLPATRLEIELLGGPDGVTAANRFATAASPDGRVLLLLPGLAGQARLVGDPRARFDPAGWLPVCAMAQPALVAGRLPLPRGRVTAPIRLGLAAPDHPASAALLAFDLLGIAAVPVLGVPPAQADAALAQGAVDAVVLLGADAPARLAALAAVPWLALGGGGREPPTALAGLPGAAAAAAPTAPRSLQAALEAALAATQLQAALVLPALTPADRVALWRGAAQRWLEEEARQPGEAAAHVRDAGQAPPLLGALAVPTAAMQAYRDWLQQRFGWRAA